MKVCENCGTLEVVCEECGENRTEDCIRLTNALVRAESEIEQLRKRIKACDECKAILECAVN